MGQFPGGRAFFQGLIFRGASFLGDFCRGTFFPEAFFRTLFKMCVQNMQVLLFSLFS